MPTEIHFEVMRFVGTINRCVDNNILSHSCAAFIRSLLNKCPDDHPIWSGPVKLLVMRLRVLGFMNGKHK